MTCPINQAKIHCQNCYFIKEGECDYPYSKNMSLEEIKATTERIKNAR